MLVKDISGKIAFYPYTFESNTYAAMIQYMLSKYYCIYDYIDLKRGYLKDVDILFFNWIENVLDTNDKEIIKKARKKGTQIVWIFHNRKAHRNSNSSVSKENIRFILQHATDIIVLSPSSVKYLGEYAVDLSNKNISYVPHPDYFSNYGMIMNEEKNHIISRLHNNKKIVFGLLGTLRRDKNVDLAIKAFLQLPTSEDYGLIIAGAPEDVAYYDEIVKLCEKKDNIFLASERVHDYEMACYIDKMDVLLMPYDCDNCLNSGVMLLAFSYSRTVITSDIAMASNYDESLIYKYKYSKDNHFESLYSSMKEACNDGREIILEKGMQLREITQRFNSKKIVENKLLKILLKNNATINEINMQYIDRAMLKLVDRWLLDILSGNEFINSLHNCRRIAIYGFGKYGKLLYKELVSKGIFVSLIIDERAAEIDLPVKCSRISEIIDFPDVIIISSIYINIHSVREYIDEIGESCYVLSLGDL